MRKLREFFGIVGGVWSGLCKMSSVNIYELNSQWLMEYTDFLLKHNYTLFYQSLEYRNFLKKLLSCDDLYLIAIKQGVISGVLPLMSKRNNDGLVYNSLPFFGSNGGIISDDNETRRELASYYNSLISSDNILSSTIISSFLISEDNVNSNIKYNFSDYRIGQFTRIENCISEESILELIDPSASRNIKKAERENIKVDIDNNSINSLKQIHYENMEVISGTPKPEFFFDLLPTCFQHGKDYNIYVARKDDNIIALLLAFYFNKTVEYFMPAIDSQHRNMQPLSLILLKAMTDAAKMGYLWWNWGGTWKSQTGVYRFKKKWGASEQKYCYYTQLNNENLLNLSSGDLLTKFPHFFVVPFSNLK